MILPNNRLYCPHNSKTMEALPKQIRLNGIDHSSVEDPIQPEIKDFKRFE